MKKKILIAVNNLSVGGAERVALNQARFLDPARFEVWMTVLMPDPEKNFSRETEFLGERFVRFHVRHLWDIVSVWRIYVFLKRERFDAVVTALFFTNTLVRGAALVARVPIIIAHEQNMYADKAWWQVLVDKLLSYGTTRIIAVSRDVLAFTAAQEHIPQEKFIVNYNAIPFGDIIAPTHAVADLKKKLGIPDGVPIAVTAGRLITQKGHTYLLRAAEEMQALHPEVKFRIVIFGEGRLRDALMRETAERGLADAVLMPGVWPTADIMALADVFVLPSLWEGLPVVLVEAMAAGKPVVTTRVSGAWELVEDGKSGFVIEPKDVSGLREKMFLLLFDADLRRRYGDAAKVRSKEFSMEKHMTVLESIIDGREN
ncbi:MAG: hypothetical protein A3I44_03750 [Candidatus Sungbacteria bacterium RIFCSPLOWO2_02_FULL_51_17]|uniref:Glycosyl transferase family 1 domain-containing protein n=1 Tax=Candidatus Sungbacteria bacterium RIFCSPHIGHO2_02_FULL_51_29 TaxID=1802273 RepID=A0A1G2KQW7_9BACT|nr:MAG: hypothetical protein A2676_03530 [Candidatus Sungbacteria bacterium RIFCSPHIGHO2_01_FULL_51_22]OHA01827.1 MAG: hypothetical protein A3C16_05935 [Candidatus Sungbacteria bacterium RIFCSPHIGHO2_02_FULL_51_29]OHA05358.1 MAG: hypothetical protein A3B29_02400 [Candidatus Sungbacteria bacterium RIFCSPLOWO2_01_FULL_51_34]OHA10502.1 MAG: hypothetical protein A3I44_03750 [Candidatus Sungbacteria bacterium RIFCSPLOWO2_02_FULL_51_17]